MTKSPSPVGHATRSGSPLPIVALPQGELLTVGEAEQHSPRLLDHHKGAAAVLHPGAQRPRGIPAVDVRGAPTVDATRSRRSALIPRR
jgi:hypothetical protein